MSTGFRHTAALVLCALAVCGSRASASTLTVTTTNDGGPASLREALAVAAPGDTIVLDVTGTITLTNGALSVMKNVTIAGPGASLLAIDAQHASRVFDVGSVWTPATVALSGVTLTNGSAGYGAGIQNLAELRAEAGDPEMTLREVFVTMLTRSAATPRTPSRPRAA